MQDQPRYEAYESSRSFADGQASRPYVEGTVARGYLNTDAAFYTGKAATGGGAQPPQSQRSGNATGNATGNGQAAGLQATTPNAQGTGTLATGDVNVRGANVGGNIPNGGGNQVGAAAQSGTPGSVNTFPFPVTAETLERGEERFNIYCSMCHGQTGYGDGMIVRRGFRRPPSFHDDRLRGETVGHFFDVITNGWGAMSDYAQQIPAQDRWAIIAYIRALQRSQNTPLADVPEEKRHPRKPGPGAPSAEGHQGTGGEREP